MNEQELFSQIPMRTWRWLGVNEIKEPAGLAGEPHRHQIVAQPGASDEVTLELRESGRHEVQAHVGKGARLHLTALQLAAEDVPVTCRIKVLVDEGGLFSYTGVEAGASETAAALTVHLAGDDARADVWSFYFGDGDRKLDLNYIIRQSGKRTDANMQVRGALLGKSVKNFRGTLDFIEGAKGSVGRENEEVMLLSDGVRNRSVPIMLSHEDDVDGHHAVAVGKMDEEKLFYLMSRGLDLAEARRLVVEAAFHPVLDRIPEAKYREEIEAYLTRRLLANG